MKVTKEQLEQKKLQAQFDNSIGWLDTEKMNKYGVQTSQPLKLTGYIKPENPFRECQTPKPHW